MQRRPKNILIVSHYYPPHIGGIEFVAYNQAKRLAASGNKVTVVTSKIGATDKNIAENGAETIRIKAFNGFERIGVPFPIFSPKIIFTLLKKVKTADVVHIHDSFYISSFIAALCARLYKKPVVLTQHVALIAHQSKIVVFIQKIVYATSGAIIFKISGSILTLNDRVEQFLIEQGVSKEKILSLHNGVDADVFYPVTAAQKKELKKKFGLSPKKKILLFVGRFVHKKGFDELLAARDDKYQIVFAGGERPAHVNDNVVFLGKLEQSKLAKLYQAADIFILPSHGEGFPLSVQEAMSCALPIITTSDHGYGRYELDKKLIYLLDHPNEKSIREAIESVLSDEQHLKKMATYSKEYATANFGWQHIISKLDSIYEKLLMEKT